MKKMFCLSCKKEIIKKPQWSYKQFFDRVSCSIECQANLRRGMPQTEAVKERLRKLRLGVKNTQEVREKISKSLKGKKKSKKHIRNALLSRGISEEVLDMNKEEKHEYRYFQSIKQKYGITKEQYYEMLEKQKGVCLICGQKDSRRLSVDHCHISGVVRGLLCTRCNAALGNVNDDIKILKKMINYLIK